MSTLVCLAILAVYASEAPRPACEIIIIFILAWLIARAFS